MSMRRIGIGFVLLAVALLVHGTAASAGEQVPIKGTFQGTVKATPLLPLPGDLLPRFHVAYSATGNISHLGRVTTEFSTPNVAFDPINNQFIADPPAWTGSITTANGDKIFGRYVFPSATVPFAVNGDFAFSAALEVTGGTGRFQGARGQGVTVGTGNLLSLEFRGELSGTISTVGK